MIAPSRPPAVPEPAACSTAAPCSTPPAARSPPHPGRCAPQPGTRPRRSPHCAPAARWRRSVTRWRPAPWTRPASGSATAAPSATSTRPAASRRAASAPGSPRAAWCRGPCARAPGAAASRRRGWPSASASRPGTRWAPCAQGDPAAQVTALRAALARLPPGGFEVWVSHQFTLSALAGTGTAPGEGLVLAGRPDGAAPSLLARLPPP